MLRCRIVAPKTSEWRDIEAVSVADAVQKTQEYFGSRYGVSYVPDKKERGATVEFCLIEVEGHGEFVSRLFRSSILRKGGVVPRHYRDVTLEDVATVLGWKRPPEDLLSSHCWEGEQEERWR